MMQKTRPSAGLTGRTLVIGMVGLLVVCIGVAVFAGIHRIEPGQAGVMVDFAAGTSSGHPAVKAFPTGQYILIFPWEFKTLVSYPISQQTLTMVRREKEGRVQGDDSVECQDARGIRINVDSSTLWRVDLEHLGELYLLRPNLPLTDSKTENDIASQVVRREVRNAITIACGQFGYDEIYGVKRVQFGEAVANTLGKSLKESYLQLDKFLLGEVYLQKEQQDAISAVANAQLQAKQAAFLAEKAENEARAAVAQAEGAKKVRILQAQAEAEAIRIVNEQLATSPKFIEYTYSQKWNGAYPSTVVLSNGQTLPIFASIPISATSSITK